MGLERWLSDKIIYNALHEYLNLVSSIHVGKFQRDPSPLVSKSMKLYAHTYTQTHTHTHMIKIRLNLKERGQVDTGIHGDIRIDFEINSLSFKVRLWKWGYSLTASTEERIN